MGLLVTSPNTPPALFFYSLFFTRYHFEKKEGFYSGTVPEIISLVTKKETSFSTEQILVCSKSRTFRTSVGELFHSTMEALLRLLLFSSCAITFVSSQSEEDNNINIYDVIAKENQRVIEERKKMGHVFGSDVNGAKVVQGDIYRFDDDPYQKTQHSPVSKSYGVLAWPRRLWRTRVVPYEIRHSGTSKLSATEARQKILQGLKEIEKVSCLTFRPVQKSTDRNWLLYVRGSGGCHSGIGRRVTKGSPTVINLGEPCVNSPIIIHETLHALGFYHEQSRRDRDQFVRIFMKKVNPSMGSNFDKYEVHESTTYGVDYDYQSIMHYSTTTFTIDGSNTIEAREDPNLKLGGSVLSSKDIRKINAAYHCHDVNKLWTEWSDWSPCVKNYRGECKRSKHRICFARDLRQCPTANEYGVEAIVQECRLPLTCRSDYAVDGYVTDWSSWSRCSSPCGFGVRTKKRSCMPPRNGGNPCSEHLMETELCRVKRCGPKRSIDSNFDDGWGPWRNKPGNAVNWERGIGKTANGNNGPRADHTTGSGYYLYLSSRDWRSNGKKGTLMSELAGTKAGPKCFRFNYMMNGKDMGKLSVYLKEYGTNNYLNMFDKRGHQSNEWLSAAITVPKLNNYFNIFIEASILFSPNSDFAIDDIYIDPVPCPLGASGCSNHNKDCDYWARNGECQKNPVWMIQGCCESCRVAPNRTRR